MNMVPKTAIFGGTFDPFHMGHFELLENIYDEICPDRIVIIPSGHPYFKEGDGKKITSAADRLGMVEAGVSGMNLPVEISHIELDKDTPSYSVETISELKRSDIARCGRYLDSEYYFLCGSDILFQIEKWHEFEKLLREVILTVTPRGDDDMDSILSAKRELEEKYGVNIIITSFHGKNISSSAIREDVAGHSDMLPAGTLEYIKEHHLYGMLYNFFDRASSR